MACSHVLAADVGGGHISCAIVELASAATVAGTLIDTGIDSKASRDEAPDRMGRRTSTIDGANHARSPRYSGHYPAGFGYRFNPR